MSDLELTKDEENLIVRFLSHYLSIEVGEDPETDSQNYSREKRIHFRQVCLGEKEPETEHEIAYLKYKKLTQAEPPTKMVEIQTPKPEIPRWDKEEPPRRGNIPETEEGSPRKEFGSRNDIKKDSAANLRDSKKNRSFE